MPGGWSTVVDTIELRRHVVRLDGPSGPTLGTGLSVAPGLVLTCAHVVKRKGVEVSVVPADGVAREGLVTACSTAPPADWAEPVWPFPDLAIIAYQGDPIGSYALLEHLDQPGQNADCITWGYQQRKDGVQPVGDPAAFRFTGISGDGFLALKDDVSRPGMSGSPLVCPSRRAVVGLVAATRGTQSPVGGWASPISGLTHLESPDELRAAGVELLAANRESALADRAPWHAVLPIADRHRALTQPWGTYAKGRRADPADLLLADFGVVTYLFREEALATAESWCLGSDRLAVATVSAVGGAGKTRFAVELCRRMAERHGWVAGELTGDLAGRDLATLPWPRLLVVDYAEAKAAGDLKDLLQELGAHASEMAPVRVLLVTRERAGRLAVEASTIRAIQMTATPLLKTVLNQRDENSEAVAVLDPAQRDRLYAAAVEDLATAWASPVPDRQPDLSGEQYGWPLAVLFEALDAVLDADPSWSAAALQPDDPFWGPEPIQRVLAHEETYWRLTAPPEARALLRECVALATLIGASTVEEGDAMLRSIPALESADAAARRSRLLDWLKDLHHGPAFVNPLRPDRLGEALVRAGFLDEYGVDGLVRVLDLSTRGQTTRALTVLGRCAGQSDQSLRAAAEFIALRHSELVARLTEPSETEPNRDDETAYLDVLTQFLTGAVGTRATEFLPADDLVAFARSLDQAGLAAAARYDYAAAQALGEAAVAHYRDDAGTSDKSTTYAHGEGLLASRNNLAYAYETAGDLGRAIPLYEQTLTDRQRILGSDHPDTLTSRNNLAGAYRTAGDLGRAIPLYEQTLTDTQRVLGSDHPNTLTSRNNLASALWQRGQQREAFILWEAAAESAVRLFGPRHEVTRTLVANLTEAHRFLDGT